MSILFHIKDGFSFLHELCCPYLALDVKGVSESSVPSTSNDDQWMNLMDSTGKSQTKNLKGMAKRPKMDTK
jgi:hypothetical protein